MDARLVGERVPAHDRLVGLRPDAGDAREHRARGGEQLAAHAGREAQVLAPDLHRHHELLERGVPRALADAVDRALDLPRARLDGGDGVGHRQAEVVVAVDGDDGARDVA